MLLSMLRCEDRSREHRRWIEFRQGSCGRNVMIAASFPLWRMHLHELRRSHLMLILHSTSPVLLLVFFIFFFICVCHLPSLLRISARNSTCLHKQKVLSHMVVVRVLLRHKCRSPTAVQLHTLRKLPQQQT
jgi:hypothetical protein